MELPIASGKTMYYRCANISQEDVRSLVLMRGISGVVCFGLCLLSLVIEVVSMLCQKRGSTVLQRFFVYVVVANLLRAAFLSMSIVSHRSDNVDINDKFCEAVGFLSQYFASFQLLTIFAMMLILLHNLLSLNQSYSILCSRLFKCQTSYPDIYAIIVLFILPSLYTWTPFLIDGGVYGDSGPWCWLKSFDSNCSEIDSVFVFESVFWNIPFGIVLLFCLVCVTLYLIFFLYVGFYRYRRKVTSVLVDTFILFLFFAFYTILCMVELAALMYIHTHKHDSYSVLVMYAITLPVGEISLSLTSFVHFFRVLCKIKKPQEAHLIHGVISNLSDSSKVEPSHRVSAKSFTSQQVRPVFLSPSTDATSLVASMKKNYGTPAS